MRISDWSSDVCSSDLPGPGIHAANEHGAKWTPDSALRPLRGDEEGARTVLRALRPHARLELHTDVGLQSRLRRFDEAAEIGARLARIDDVLDAEGLGGTEGRAVDAQLLLQLLLALLRIGRRFDLAPESDGDTALDRQRAPFRGRPGDRKSTRLNSSH